MFNQYSAHHLEVKGQMMDFQDTKNMVLNAQHFKHRKVKAL